MKITKNLISIFIITALVFTTMPIACNNFEVQAATSYWKSVSAHATGQNTASVNWKALTKKQKKKIKGITVFRNGVPISNISKNSTSFNDSRLAAGTYYTYQLKTYKTKVTKTRKWYNKATGQYQKKKPPKKYRGKRKTFKTTTYKYSNSSAKVTIRTAAAPPPPVTPPTPSIDPGLTSNGNTSIGIGETYDLNIKTKSGGTITCSSSNTNVATVNNSGIVTGKTVGSTTITINVAAKDKYKSGSKKVTIIVSKDPEFLNSSLPTTDTYDLSVGNHTFKVNAKSGVTWSSSNLSVAKPATGIEGMATPGKIYFVGAGTATLTVKSKTSGDERYINLTINNNSTGGEPEPTNPPTNPPGGTTLKEFKVTDYTKNVNIKTASYSIKTQLPGDGFDVVWSSADSACIQINGSASIDSQNLSTQNIIAKKKYGNIALIGTLIVPDGVNYTGTKTIKIVINNTVYPINDDGSYTLTSNGEYWWCGGVKVRIDELFNILPSGTTFRVNIPDINNGIL